VGPVLLWLPGISSGGDVPPISDLPQTVFLEKAADDTLGPPRKLPEKDEKNPSTLPVPRVLAGQLDLAACQRIALEKQPAILAARTSLAAAVARAQSVENLHVPAFLARDLPVRRQQASTGVHVAEAAVILAENNTRYAITFCYLAALYAEEQEAIGKEAIGNLRNLRELAEEYLAEGKGRSPQRDLDLLDTYLAAAEAQIQEPIQGKERALSALREAMGVGPDCPLTLSRRTLYDVSPPVDQKAVVALALTRRPELVMATHGAEVAALEACAQALRRQPSAPTYASGSDLHSQPVPAGSFDENYRPAALAPEMPTTLNGSRKDRVEMAKIYAARSEIVVEKVRNLLILETEQVYLRWQESDQKLRKFEAAAAAAHKVFLDREAIYRSPEPKDRKDPKRFNALDALLDSARTATRLRLAINESRYRRLLALAGLEHATVCGFQAGFESAPPDAPRKFPEKNGSKGK
jgi:hypothetical protein